MTLIHKQTTADVDPRTLEYVMSDATVDRYGDVIEPKGWQLDRFKANPIALFGHSGGFPVGKWADIRVEGGKLKGRLEFAAPGTSARIDEIRSLAEQGILRAVSVGFHPVPGSVEPVEGKPKGVRYKQAELVECSIVSVPANPNALQIARSLEVSPETQELVFGTTAADDGLLRRDTSGTTAARHPTHRVNSMSYSEQIEAKQASLVAKRDEIALLVKDVADEREGATEALERANQDAERIEGSLLALKGAEKHLAVKAAVAQAPAIVQHRPFAGEPARNLKASDHLVRAAVVALVHGVTRQPISEILREKYPDDTNTPLVLQKAAVAPATTTTSGWASELVQTGVAEFLESLRAASIYPALAGAGMKLTFGPMQGAIKIPSRASTPSIGGSFVAEGSAIPVRKLGLTSITLTPHKIGAITTFTREIARYSTPAIEGLLRQEIEADTAATIDSLLLDTTASSTTRPAGLRNGVSGLTATAGGGWVSFLGDLVALTGPFYTANAGRNLVLLLNPVETLAIATMPGPDGQMAWTADLMRRFVVVESTAVTAGMAVVVDAADFVSASGDEIEFDVSETATLHEEDTSPTALSAVGSPNTAAAPTRSLWQTGSIGLRMLMPITWAMRRTGMIQFVTAVNWGDPVA